MIACLDVSYQERAARAACVTFEHWGGASVSGEFALDVPEVHPYVPGQFYQRELPCLLSILERLQVQPEAIVVDGYVWLDEKGRKGLGAHLFETLGESAAIIAVAKTRFGTATHATEVLRGSSSRPLFITAAEIAQEVAADCIRQMHGDGRIPTLLKRVDQLSRQNSGHATAMSQLVKDRCRVTASRGGS